MSKFEKKEKSIASAENTLIEEGKYISAEYDENHSLHNEIHEEGVDSMLMKGHMKSHQNMLKERMMSKMRSMEVESSMVCEG